MEEKIVSFIKKPATLRLVYFIGCMALSFFFGVYAHYSLTEERNSPTLVIPEQPLPLAYRYKNPEIANPYDLLPAVSMATSSGEDNSGTVLSGTNQDEEVPAQKPTQNYAFVASKTGSKYYPVDCGSVSRIKPENRVYFATETAALEKGYERTSACK